VFNDMGSPDYRETFTYAARELDAYGLAYLHVMDGLAFGFHELGDPVTLAQTRVVFHGPLMGNCGYDSSAAEAAIADGSADLIAFGRPFIANPDFVERVRNEWPLAESDPSKWYSGQHAAEGYTDYPTFAQAESSASVS
jgi:2,4-dienoyl-CoA reductase-like NADH-dependent reductase (Old Yellow Enzyme family)